MTDINDIISLLDAEWEIPDGFFYKVRQGQLDEDGYERVISILKSVKVFFKRSQATQIDRKLVGALWYIPIYLSWQDERIKEREGNEAHDIYGRWCSRVVELMVHILGHP